MNITKGKINKPVRVVIYGPEGIGKSTFASQFPEPLFIDTEGSTNQLDVARMDTPTSWTMLIEQIKWVCKNPNVCKTLIIDTVDWAERYCIEHVCAKHNKTGIEEFGYGNGYVYVAEEFGRFLNLLNDVIDAGINIVLTAHAQIRKFEQPEEFGGYDHWELKLGKKTSSQTSPLVKEWADMLLFANYKIVSVAVDDDGKKRKAQGGKRIMYTTHHPCWDAKNRFGLKEEIPFDFDSISHIFTNKENQKLSEDKVEKPEDIKTEKEEIKGARYFRDNSNNTVFEVLSEEEKPGEECSEISLEEYEKSYSKELKEANDDFNKIVGFTPEEKTNVADLAFTIKEKNKRMTWADAMKEAQRQVELQIKPTVKEEVKSLVNNKALNDLMINNNVKVEEIQKVVGKKGYYPEDTPVDNYDEGFINGVLVGAWEQVFKMIKEMRGE